MAKARQEKIGLCFFGKSDDLFHDFELLVLLKLLQLLRHIIELLILLRLNLLILLILACGNFFDRRSLSTELRVQSVALLLIV